MTDLDDFDSLETIDPNAKRATSDAENFQNHLIVVRPYARGETEITRDGKPKMVKYVDSEVWDVISGEHVEEHRWFGTFLMDHLWDRVPAQKRFAAVLIKGEKDARGNRPWKYQAATAEQTQQALSFLRTWASKGQASSAAQGPAQGPQEEPPF